MLQEPEDGIAEDAIVEIVDMLGEYYETVMALARSELDVRSRAALGGHLPVTFCHGAGYPCEVG
jgi:hypothetical protein